MKKLLEFYKILVFGEDSDFNIQKKIFLLITHISIIIGIVGIVVDIVLNLGLFLTIITVLTVLTVLFFHIQVRNTQLSLKYSVSFFLISLIVLPVLWIYNGGYNGNNIILIFVYFTVILTILPPRIRVIALVVFLIMISSLTLLHFNYPELISDYENENHRFIDLIIGYFMYLVLAYNIHNIILKNYEMDRKKVNEQNQQLNQLVDKLNDTNKKLEESITHVEELNSSKDRFITILSHDLRSPFQGLLGITKTLETNFNSISNDEKQFYITRVNRSLEKLYTFLEQLLLWGRVQRSSLKLNYTNCDVKSLIDQTVTVLSETASKKKIIVDVNCLDLFSWEFDREMIGIVLRNLLSNAIKFSPVGSRIVMIAEQDQDQLKISIIDHGLGISEKSINKLFNLDENFSTIGTDGEQGTGMGLILCSDILKKHNGRISVQTKEGRGSTFTFTIPPKK